MSLLKMIAQYERETENYILKLEVEIESLKEKLNESTRLLMAGEAARERLMFQAIVGGAFDKLKPEVSSEG